MDIRNIEYFLHLARYQHVSATADFLNISQPSLSKHINSLEKELGVKLFDRIGNRIVLNKNGEQFAQYARQSIDLLNLGVNAAKSNVYETTGTIHIAYATYAPILAKCCAEYARLNPQTTLQTVSLDSAIRSRSTDGLDFLLKAVPYRETGEEPNDLFWVPQPLFQESYVLVYGPNVARELGGPPAHLSDLWDTCFVTMVPKDVFFTDITYSLCLNAGFYPKVHHETDEFLVKVKLIQEELAVAFLPQACLADAMALAPNLRYMELSDITAKRTILLMRRKKALMSETALDFWEFVLDYYHLPPDMRD